MKYHLIFAALLASTSSFADDEIIDPTRPSYYSNKTSTTASITKPKAAQNIQTWTLETTLADSKRIMAIINGKQVVVGDEVDGAYVMKITHQQVTLKHDDELFDIKLHKSFTGFMK